MIPFKLPVIGLALLGLLVAQEEGDWDVAKQKATVERWEKTWQTVDGLISKGGGEKKNEGLDRYADLRGEMVRDGRKITDEGLSTRVEDLEVATMKQYAAIKWALLERLAKRGQKILAVMDGAYRERKYVDVVRLCEEDLEAHAELMSAVDKDFLQVADDLRKKGKVLSDDAEIGIEFQGLGLEVVSIQISEDGGEPSSAIILNRKEESPEGRRYVKDDTVLEEPSVKIGSILRDRVVCIYKAKWSIDLFKRDGKGH